MWSLGEKCKTESGAKSTSKICSGAETDSKLDAHLIAGDKKSSDGRYQAVSLLLSGLARTAPRGARGPQDYGEELGRCFVGKLCFFFWPSRL